MIEDVLAGSGLIGMVLLKPGWEEDYEGSPPIHQMACVGQIVHAERFSDGRYNIVLHGLTRVKIQEIESKKPYRTAHIEVLMEPETGLPLLKTRRLRMEVFEAFSRLIDPPPWGFTVFSAPHMDLGILSDLIAFSLPCEPQNKQRVLEALAVEHRAHQLLKLLEGEESKGSRIRIRRLPFVRELARN